MDGRKAQLVLRHILKFLVETHQLLLIVELSPQDNMEIHHSEISKGEVKFTDSIAQAAEMM